MTRAVGCKELDNPQDGSGIQRDKSMIVDPESRPGKVCFHWY